MISRLLFKAKVPNDLLKYIGRDIIIPEFMNIDGKKTKVSEQKVRIETIVGNRFQPQFYEINGMHLIGMLRFHAQMEKAKDITEDQIEAFEQMQLAVKSKNQTEH